MKSLKDIARMLRPEHFDPVSKTGAFVLKSNGEFFHSGDLGDIIYALPALRAMGGGRLLLGPTTTWKTRQTLTKEIVDVIKPLLKLQPYITEVVYTDSKPDRALDMNQFREYLIAEGGYLRSGLKRLNLAQAHLYTFKLPLEECDKPWLTLDVREEMAPFPVVIHRSPRWRNPDFPWRQVMDRHAKRAVFVGYKEEYEEFINAYGYLPHKATASILDLARVIAGAKLFIGNQSLPYALCESLKIDSLLEVWNDGPNCLFLRPNAVYGESSLLVSPFVDKLTPEKVLKCPVCGSEPDRASVLSTETEIVRCVDCSVVYVRNRLTYDQIINYRRFAKTVTSLVVENKPVAVTAIPPTPTGEVNRKSLWTDESVPVKKPMWLAKRTEGHETVFYMSGDLGDIIYALPTIRVLGGGQLCIGPARNNSYYWLREPMTKARFDMIEPLLSLQKAYLTRVWFSETMHGWKCHVDLNDSRRLHREPYYRHERNLADVPSIFFQCGLGNWKQKWLDIPARKVARFIFARSMRYPGKDFPWKRLVERYRNDAVFVGMPEEHAAFEAQFGQIKHYPTKTLLDVACVIAGAEWFVGNQSSPLAIAEGLKANCVREHFEGSPNCIFDRNGHTADPSFLLC